LKSKYRAFKKKGGFRSSYKIVKFEIEVHIGVKGEGDRVAAECRAKRNRGVELMVMCA
jgi:hypothetical protein